jgi:hypothetical protein
LIVIFLCYGPVDFNNDRPLTGLTFWEWVLRLDCGVALWALDRGLRECGSQKVCPGALESSDQAPKVWITRHSENRLDSVARRIAPMKRRSLKAVRVRYQARAGGTSLRLSNHIKPA